MHPPTRDVIAKHLHRLRHGLRHAFATDASLPPLSETEVALLERVAAAVVARGMAAPAVVFLESLGPMNFLGSQALHVLTPLIDLACDAREVEQIARLLERRDTVARLVTIIEAQSSQ
jgi:hypothetical protein